MEDVDVVLEAVEIEETNLMNKKNREMLYNSSFQFENKSSKSNVNIRNQGDDRKIFTAETDIFEILGISKLLHDLNMYNQFY